MKNNRGFTLLEMAVVLGVIATLAAMLTPLVTGYIDQARSTRADADTAAIAQAMLLYRRDTGKYPIFNLRSDVNPAKPCMVSGTGTALPTGTNHATWAALCTSMAPLQNYLNINSLGYSTNTSSYTLSYRGPYLAGLDGSDPWGQPYVVTTSYLVNETYWAFVISAGPNAGLDSSASQPRASAPLTALVDDTIAMIH